MHVEHLDWNEILTKIQNFATSGTARLSLQELPPKSNADEARLHLKDVFDAMTLLAQGPRPFMESLDLFEPWHSRIKRGAVLKALEIKDVRSFCLEVIALHEVLKVSDTAWAHRTNSQLMQAEEPLSAIDQILTPRGEIRSDASEKLYNLFREKDNLGRQIEHTLDRLVKAHDMQTYLQDKYVTTRDGRWVLPVRSGSRHSVDGVIHGSSHTKQTVFMEPSDVIPLNNRLRQVEVEIEDEIERLLTQLSEYLATKSQEFGESRSLLAEADVLLAQAQFSTLIDGKGYEFSEDEILLNDVKHPLLVVGKKNPVANTVQMPQEKSILLLSGPNAGGKTVLMKSIGLAAQMARVGLPICAGEGSRLPFFEKILVGIGDSQNVGAELSTFAAHLKVLYAASELKGFHNLILVDEICGATDPEEGSALGRAFIEKFSKNKTFAIITSHLGPLKSGWTPEDRVLNGSLEYDSKSGRPTYQFIQGIPGDSLAIQTAKRVGVPSDLIERAMTLLSPVTRSRLAGLEQIEQIKNDLHLLQDSLKREKSKTQSERDKYQKMMAEHEKEKENLLAKALRDAQRKVDELIQAARVDETFKKHRSLQEIKNQLPEIVKSRAGAPGAPTAVTTSEEFGKRFPPGTKVYIPSLGQDGLIQSTPNAKGEILVLSNSIRLSLPWTELKPPMVAQNPTAEILRRSGPVTVALHDSDRVIDLRGMTVEESLEQLEIGLDQAATAQEDRIKIIHGHGTEALKKAVRTYLSRSVYVKKWKAGSPEQGGDGVTWAEIGDA